MALALMTVTVAAQEAAWERRVEQSFVPRGLAKIERVGNRWALTVLCRGPHTTYLEPGRVDHSALADQYVQARYHYVDVAATVACVRGPCAPTTERRVVLERADPLRPSPTALEVMNAQDRCEPDSGVLR